MDYSTHLISSGGKKTSLQSRRNDIVDYVRIRRVLIELRVVLL
jgi:hypothetical protein